MMKMDRVLLTCLVGTGLAAGCSHLKDEPRTAAQGAPSAERTDGLAGTAPASGMAQPADASERARMAARDFASTLKTRLMNHVRSEGLVSAIGFCHQEAPRIANEVGQKYQVSLGRVPVEGRLRNPANAAEGWQAAVMSSFERRHSAGEPVDRLVWMQTQGAPEGVAVRMARGIPVEKGCLACHGKEIGPEIQAALHRHYPEDEARGFAEGDLRGLLWVEVPRR